MCKQKVIFFLSAFVFSFSSLFAQSAKGDESAKLIEVADDSDEDFDSLFDDAEDSETPVVTEEPNTGTNYNVQIGSLKFPIEVSGQLNTELGGAYIREDGVNDLSFYFDFKNYIYFITRPDKYLALRGTIKTAMPKDSGDTLATYENHLLYLYELYFDYLFWDRIYITAGKKKSVWGNIRLFSDYYDTSENISNTDDDKVDDSIDDGVEDARYTNILYDSRQYISGIIKFPFRNHTFTALAMYNDDSTISSTKTVNMSLAFSAEFIFLGTSLNLFGRRFQLSDLSDEEKEKFYKDNGYEYTKPLSIAGLELKRTLFGFDVYGQSIIRIQNGWKIGRFFSSGFDDKSAFNRFVTTLGTYRLWSDQTPYFGFNFEFQNVYRPNPSDTQKYFVNRFAIQFGMAKLGPDKNIKPAIQWNHNITDKTGFFKAGVIFGRVMPHCDWRVGMKYEYGKVTTASSSKYTKLTLGTYITIDLDY
ncbi:hypothetical protein [uncultured Treponema sp.]|uniref:hypothetical protein n=1 Tax=uncultured Treponema sp. TaxID=162155 RepID=UPI0025E19C01|nr:hypothetical protein [uncultured Treponema sp.]